jgi:hypothetical protein
MTGLDYENDRILEIAVSAIGCLSCNERDNERERC